MSTEQRSGIRDGEQMSLKTGLGGGVSEWAVFYVPANTV